MTKAERAKLKRIWEDLHDHCPAWDDEDGCAHEAERDEFWKAMKRLVDMTQEPSPKMQRRTGFDTGHAES